MGKTITLRIDDDTYDIFRTAAQAQRRTISNFIEYATLSHVTEEAFVDDHERQALPFGRRIDLQQGIAPIDLQQRAVKVVAEHREHMV